jgi:hypothetical protein
MSLNWHLPPLILHPFSGGGSTSDLLEGSSAALALSGLSRSDDDEEELRRRVLVGRYQEIRMLLFLGKDLFRWLQQCVDFMERSSGADPRITEQSFASLLVEDPPRAVSEKLERWGVTDRRAVFSRAIGVNSLFTSPPPFETLSPILVKNYHRFADHAYICFQHLHPFLALDPKRYDFEIYASEEYAKMLSDQWERDAEIQGGH